MVVRERGSAQSTARHGGCAAVSRRPWWVWAVPFAVVASVLLARNSFIFYTPLYEDADMGANSILIEQARRFSLLVGNYSREQFNHPGPAYLYVQSWGESLFWAALRLVPTAWNGQLIAVYALNALFAALVVGTGYGWIRSVRGASAVFAVVLLFGAVHPAMFSSDWMPYMYVPTYFCFLVAAASVAAGRVQDAWIAALSGWFLIHGHVCFLFFVPFLSLGVVAALGWPRRRSLGSSLRRFLGGQRRVWVPVVAISVLFLIPIVAELALHWPGNFGKYFSYGLSSQAGGHGTGQVLSYTLWFWWQGRLAWAVPLVLYPAAIVMTRLVPAGSARRFCVWLLVFDALSTLAFVIYAAIGINNLTQHYIGYFYWSAPVISVLVIAVGVVETLSSRAALARRAGIAFAVAGAVAACAAFAVAPQTRLSTEHTDPNDLSTGPDTDQGLPGGVARLAALSAGRPIVLQIAPGAWPEVTGILVQAERTGVTACVASSYWEFMVTSQFICTPAELSEGVSYRVYQPGQVPLGRTVLVRLRRGIVTGRAK
jgi:hypothetical protein